MNFWNLFGKIPKQRQVPCWSYSTSNQHNLKPVNTVFLRSEAFFLPLLEYLLCSVKQKRNVVISMLEFYFEEILFRGYEVQRMFYRCIDFRKVYYARNLQKDIHQYFLNARKILTDIFWSHRKVV